MAVRVLLSAAAVVLCLQLGTRTFVAASEGDVIEDDIKPLNVAAEEVPDNERAERSIFGFGKKAQPAATGYSSSYGGSTGGGYGSQGFSVKTSGFGGYGGLKTVGYGGVKTNNYGTGFGHTGYGGSGSYGIKTSDGAVEVSDSSLVSKTLNLFGIGKGRPSQLTNDFLLNARQMHLPSWGACPSYSLPPNVQHSCRGDQCEVSCPGRYTFPDGKTQLRLVCVSGQWIIRDSEYEQVPPCQASCVPPCQNNGICLEAGICKCPENYSGPLCQYKKSICASKPPIPKNSKVTCTNNICNAECMRGFQFPDGSSITNIECQDGQWIHPKTGLSKPPDCGPICQPPCANGGQCISFNMCQCAKKFRGDHCQYNIDSCNVTKTAFNGNYKCAYDNEEAKCMFSCPTVPGLKVDGSLEIEYKCKYESGEFYPLPLPKCIYPPGYSLRQGSKTSHYTKKEGFVVGGGSGSYGVQYLTEHEKIMAIIAKYKDYDRRSEWFSSEESFVSPSSYSLYVTGDMNLVIDRTARPAMCTTWGGINLKTFDGLVLK